MTDTATRTAAPAGSGALSGLRVVEMGFAAAGPLVGKYLANFGAEVIRLESRLAADVFRTTYPPFKDGIVGPDRAAMFAFYNDGKRSATLNLKHPKGVALARALIGLADVFVESFTPGTVARLGLGPLERDVAVTAVQERQAGPEQRRAPGASPRAPPLNRSRPRYGHGLGSFGLRPPFVASCCAGVGMLGFVLRSSNP